mgnify:CR=1 FL=1
MNLKTSRWVILALMSLLVIAAVIFYQRQNAGEQIGGGISLAKTLWLAFAIGAWFCLPPVLMLDTRIDTSIRRILRWFWIAMLARGAIELVCLYLVEHWHPWYGIGHDLFCLGLLLLLRRGATATGIEDRRALAFTGTLCISLIAETCFATMFMQSGAHADGIYFASADPSWNYVNFITWIVVAYVYLDTLGMLVALYFPGMPWESPQVLKWTRLAAASTVVVLVMAAMGYWSHMMRVEREAEQYKQIGYAIMDDCYDFTKAFLKGDAVAMSDIALPCQVGWQLEPVNHEHDFEIVRWSPTEPKEDLRAALGRWREDRADVVQAAFKIHLIDEIVSPTEAVIQWRFEVTSQQASDAGMFRCRFVKCDDDHWRIQEAKLLEGETTRSRANAFVDRAAAAGVDFIVLPDPRFQPGAACSVHDCNHPGELRFQMMRFAYASCSAADFDGDGHDDVFFCSGQQPKLMCNRGDGTFADVTKSAGLSHLWHINTVGFADVDNDGDQDLFAFAFYGRNYVFENNGDGTFSDVSEKTSLMNDDIIACYAFLDYDNDGDLDLYLGRPLDAREQIPDSFLYTRNGQPNILYRNDGDFRFTDVTAEAGAGDVGLTLSLAAADYDSDGDQDLYLGNDFGRNVLLQNQGDGTFKDVAKETGSLAIGGSMSASWGDYNNDGRLDMYVAAIRSNQRWFVQPITARRVMMKFFREGRFLTTNPLFKDLRERMGEDWLQIGNHALAGNSLLEQQADGTFIDRAEESGTRPAGWYWSSGFFDLDNDADLDIYAADGWITGENPHDL